MMRWLGDKLMQCGFFVFALVFLPAVSVAQPPPVKRPVPPQCRCSPQCDCGQCYCDFWVGGQPAAKTVPSDAARYGVVYGRVMGGELVRIAIGKPYPVAYGNAEEVFPSGFMGIPDGVYDCRLAGGKPTMQMRAPIYGTAAPQSCPGGVCPTCPPAAPRGLFFRR